MKKSFHKHPNVPMKRNAMRKDESAAAAVPSTVTPPESPFGTFVNVIIETGSLWLSIPISLAIVSASASAIAAANATRAVIGNGEIRERISMRAAGSPFAATCIISLSLPFFPILSTPLTSFPTTEPERKKKSSITIPDTPPI